MAIARAPHCLVGLIGTGLSATRTPAMHEREGRAQGLNYLYNTIDLDVLRFGPDALPDLLIAAERMGFAGLNITHPCKQSVIPLLDELSPDARALGAVNTVVLRGGRRVGHNTDWFGFAENMRRNLPGAPLDRVVLFGAGGAGSAVAHALLSMGCRHLAVVDPSAERLGALVRAMAAAHGADRIEAASDGAAAIARADGVVHATPTGMASHPGMAFPAAWLRPSLWVAEVVYFPLTTELLARARDLGCRTVDGGGMAVFQAVEAFRLFSGIAPDAARMAAHFREMGAD